MQSYAIPRTDIKKTYTCTIKIEPNAIDMLYILGSIVNITGRTHPMVNIIFTLIMTTIFM